MIRYKKYQSNRRGNTKDKWYARAVASETIDIDGLAKHMASHNTPYSQGCIRGVLHDLADCVKELLLEGKNVKLENLAIFSVGISCTPADTAQAFSAANIKAYTLRARATGQLRPTTMKGQIKVAEHDDYTKPTDNTAEDGE